ncbi:MAG: O-antigen ligase family protein [Bacteroidales bacterium]
MKFLGISFNHSKIYYWALVLAAVSLPLSKFTLSISLIVLVINWILEGNLKKKLDCLRKNVAFWAILIIFLIHIAWLINTTNFNYAFHDLKNKIILVVFPMVMFSSKLLSRKEFQRIILWFSAAVIASSIISTAILVELINAPIDTPNGISIFISHIRFSLLINVAIFSMGYLVFSNDYNIPKSTKIVLVTSVIWLVFFLFLLKSLTGIIIFLVVLFIIITIISFKINFVVYRLFVQVGILTIFLLTATFLTHSISKFYSTDRIDVNQLEKHTLSGNLYSHNLSDKQIENGHYVWLYLSSEELEKEWNKRSKISIHEKDNKGQLIYYTAVRYLTSLNLRKDSVGVSQLTNQDVQNIESGMANHIYVNKYALYPRIYQVLWEFDVFNKNQNPAGNSTTQRILFLKTANKIISKNFFTGVGTGDVQDAFSQQYIEDESQLPENRRHRAHNQWVTFLLTFGVFGFIIVLIAFFYPLYYLKAYRSFLFAVFFLIAFMSMLNEDTLETQTGVSFFSYFYSLFLLEIELLKKQKNNEQDE